MPERSPGRKVEKGRELGCFEKQGEAGIVVMGSKVSLGERVEGKVVSWASAIM